ncbi:TRAP transporter small permease [Brachybacterium sacelli]|uniref:TRAP-type C4-dicarboxylate transport system permease small subunit n=1 Tax=Brachybacterium sacelli TaxID=173364 RepID=A0ABS4WZX8_9MICO|nr:TRAP transporter small permease subunit [Brachybacterium sacelli]MBP2381533.1 TRAP-type C4-dicarboxylate transport system permease small subunit [Brachybacterium sacelli]
MEKLEKLESAVAAAEKAVVTICLTLAFASVLIQIARRVFDLMWFPDVYDLALVCAAVMTFLCVGLLTYTQGHIAIDLTSYIPSPTLRLRLLTASVVAVIVFVAIFGKLAIDLFLFGVQSGSHTVQLKIPLLIPYGALVLGLALCLFHSLMHWNRMRKDPEKIGASEDGLSDAVTGEVS